MSGPERLRLLDLPVAEALPALEEIVLDLGEKPFRAKQVLSQVYRRRMRSFDRMTDLPEGLRTRLGERVQISLLELSHRAAATDGTVKYLWRLGDGNEIESVVMPTDDHLSFCVSCQVGCALSCRFCATGSLGLRRNLTPGEMVDQVFAMLEDLGSASESLSVVFMGMGEPGYAMDGVLAACRSLNDAEGVGIGARHLTISTSGVLSAIERLTDEPLQVRLALSLHSGDQAKREGLMDIAKKFTISDLLDACLAYQCATGRRITLEYAVMPGLNDSRADAESLAAFANAVPSKINLIPYNPVAGFECPPSSERDAARFREEVARLFPGDIMVRKTRGRDIEAACGMLHRARAKEDPS